jgi:NADPH2:quinone reductase
MKAMLCRRFGPIEALDYADLPDPVPAEGEAVVDVKAAALNFFDTLIVQGKYQIKPPFPFSPAAEFAGIVSAAGAGVSAVKIGDRVCGYHAYGSGREKVCVRAETLVKVPDAIELERAAGMIVTYGTSLHALRDRAQLKKGETLAVLGAAGGVGLAAVEIGKIIGARVIACASSQEKLDFTRKHGADETINYSKEDLKERLRELTGGEGVDVVFDPVGGPFSEASVRATAWEGRHLVIGFANGEIPKLPLNHVLLRGCSVVGVAWGNLTRRNPARLREFIEQAMQWAQDGKISAHVDKTYPLAKTVEALGAISRREVKGKIILTV